MFFEGKEKRRRKNSFLHVHYCEALNFENLKVPATIPYSLLVISGFVVATSELFREDVLKMNVALPGRRDAFRQWSQKPWQSMREVQLRFSFLLLIKIQTELQLAFVMEIVLLRRYLFG